MRNATASTTGFSPSSRPSLPPADYSYPLTNPQQGALADHRVQVREVEAAMQGVEPEPPRGGCLPHRGSGQPLPRGGAFSACTMVNAWKRRECVKRRDDSSTLRARSLHILGDEGRAAMRCIQPSVSWVRPNWMSTSA